MRINFGVLSITWGLCPHGFLEECNTMEIGDPVRRRTVIPLKEPITKPIPEPNPAPAPPTRQPVKQPEKV